jgi:hypothetical protein
MMRLVQSALLISALTIGAALVPAGSATALPLAPATGGAAMAAQLDQSSSVIDVQWRRHGYYGRGGYYRRGGGVGAGVAAGLIGGAIVGGIIASQQPVYAAPPPGDPAISYCMQRFRSYDPGSMTYLGFDGLRHPCP